TIRELITLLVPGIRNRQRVLASRETPNFPKFWYTAHHVAVLDGPMWSGYQLQMASVDSILGVLMALLFRFGIPFLGPPPVLSSFIPPSSNSFLRSLPYSSSSF
ncbi:13081_t:CDS:2, partial [Acaulospora colombiana]